MHLSHTLHQQQNLHDITAHLPQEVVLEGDAERRENLISQLTETFSRLLSSEPWLLHPWKQTQAMK